MDVILFAAEQEYQIEQHYQQLAQIAPHTGICQVLTQLGRSACTHRICLEQLHRKTSPQTGFSLDLSQCSAMLRDTQADIDHWGIDMAELDLYGRARDVALQIERFYLDRAAECMHPQDQACFKKLAQDEHRHFIIMHDLCDLLARSVTSVARRGEIKSADPLALAV